MVTYILRRTLMSLPILLGITILSFAIMKAADVTYDGPYNQSSGQGEIH